MLPRRRRMRSKDSVNFKKEPPIDKLISMLLELNVPVKKTSVNRDNVKPEKQLIKLRSLRISKSLASSSSRIEKPDMPLKPLLLERNSWPLSPSRRLTKSRREESRSRDKQLSETTLNASVTRSVRTLKLPSKLDLITSKKGRRRASKSRTNVTRSWRSNNRNWPISPIWISTRNTNTSSRTAKSPSE